jgi:hypothetical protein
MPNLFALIRRHGWLTMLGVLLATVLTIDFTAKFPNEGSYWLFIAMVRTAGMVMGDLLGLQQNL